MTEPRQLRLGWEVGDPGAPVANAPRGPVGPAGRAVLEYLRDHDEIGPAMAGRILHALKLGGRTTCGIGARGGPYTQAHPARNRVACCSYATQDGWLVLTRLEGRGLVEKVGRGRYVPVTRGHGMADSQSPTEEPTGMPATLEADGA